MKSILLIALIACSLVILLTNVHAAPASFDSRVQWPTCIRPVQDSLGNCNSYWAIASAMALGDRRCIASGINIPLSYQYLVNCVSANQGCNGGSLLTTWQFLMATGTVSESCKPYTGTWGSCPSKCVNGSPKTSYYASSAVSTSGIASVQAEILASGPVTAQFPMYQDFLYYSTGIYKHTSGSLLGNFGVVVYGWDTVVVNGVTTQYWIITPNIGTQFGEQGYAKVAFGQGIENNVVYGNAKV